MSFSIGTNTRSGSTPHVAHAFNIRLPDPALHAYAQRYCFLNGPDPTLNRQLRQAVLDSTVPLADERDDARITFLSLETLQQIEDDLRARLQVPVEFDLSPRTLDDWILNLGWKVAAIPASAQSVLVIGSATCREALFIRHHLPQARIACADFADERLRGVERALDIEFVHGDFNDLLAGRERSFDVVFSNHVLEHLFDPGRTLRLARRALTPGGCLVAALPLDGQPMAPFSGVLNTRTLHALDMCTIDVAHGWKTNVTALIRELRAAGFDDCSFTGRDRYFSYANRIYADRRAFQRRARIGLFLNRLLFGSTRAVLKVIFTTNVPGVVSKTVFGIEQRAWFGSNRLKNEFSVECLVVAR
jgi:SAM-dependent methyltransferase